MSVHIIKYIILIIFFQSNSAAELKILTKEQWKGRHANGTMNSLQLPVPKVIIAHTATDFCFSEEECAFNARFIQDFHTYTRKYFDIAYNFLVGGDGVIYEGRGWNKQGAHTRRHNKESICIAFIGLYTTEEPLKVQLTSTKLLLEKGVLQNKLSPNYKLFGHRQLMNTESPGDKLYEIIKTWPHWSEV